MRRAVWWETIKYGSEGGASGQPHTSYPTVPMCLFVGLSFQGILMFGQVKKLPAGEVKPLEETQTAKRKLKRWNGWNITHLGLHLDLRYTTIRLTNLITFDPSWGDLLSSNIKGIWVMFEHFIISLFTKQHTSLDITHSESSNTKCRDPSITAHVKELRDHLRVASGYNLRVPKNHGFTMGSAQRAGGDGVIVVRRIFGRVTVSSQMIRTLSSKAGQQTIRGSGVNIVSATPKDINIKAIANLKNLVLAYESIKSKPGNMTEGTSPETLDGISLDYLKVIQKDLRSGSFSFPPARRIQIPKPGKKETLPLTIASPRDKVVQKAMQLVMEPVFEKTFLDCSHGFRPKRGTKTAIQYVDAKFQSSYYIIEADFTKAFDSISHNKLMEYLRETITCEKVLGLIKSGLKAGYIELGNLHENLSEGTPQGSILSPLLCNIFLHKLDLYMEDIKTSFNVGTKKQKSKEYMSLVNKCKYMRNKGTDKTNPSLYQELQKKMLSTPSVVNNDSYTRINYVRYADDFIIGVEGSYQIAVAILEKIQSFINNQLGLKLNPDKTGIIKYSVRPVKFLGYIIMAPYLKGIEKPLETIRISNRNPKEEDSRLIARRKKIRIRFHMDFEKVLKRLETNYFIRKRVSHASHGKLIYRGTFRGNLINLDHADIIRYYNSVMRGIYNYYDFTLNISNLANVMWLLTESCALTLARKFKIKTLAKIFQKLGKDLGCDIELKSGENKRVSIFKPVDFTKKSIIATGAIGSKDPFAEIDKVWNAKFTRSNLFKACVVCGGTEGIEMHHVRKIRDLKNQNTNLDFFTRQMAAINRKQIPLCKPHHVGLHNNSWTEIERAAFRNAIKQRDKKSKGRLAKN